MLTIFRTLICLLLLIRVWIWLRLKRVRFYLLDVSTNVNTGLLDAASPVNPAQAEFLHEGEREVLWAPFHSVLWFFLHGKYMLNKILIIAKYFTYLKILISRHVDFNLQGEQTACASTANVSHTVWQLTLAPDERCHLPPNTVIFFGLKSWSF